MEAPQKPIRALQLGMSWFPDQAGGLDRYFHQLLHSLPQSNVEVHGLVMGSDSVSRDSGGSVRAVAKDTDSVLHRWKRVRQCVDEEIRSFRPDLLVSHFSLYAAPALRSGKTLPHVVHFHGPWAMECRAEGAGFVTVLLKKHLEKWVYRSCDLCIVLSDAFRRILVEQYDVAPDRIRVIPGGVDTARFQVATSRDAARQSLGWPTDRPIVLAVRRLVNRMGLEQLLSAIDAVRRKRPDVLLVIAGKGPLKTRLEAMIQQRGLGVHVQLVGFLPDEQLPSAMRAADFTIVPSTSLEGFGLTAVESLAAGTPVLVTPVGGLPEVVKDLMPSLILSDSTADAIAEGIESALAGRLKLPSERQCVDYAQRFDWSVVTPHISDVYRQALQPRS